MRQLRLGIDIACRAPHQASLADETGKFLWTGRRFRTDVEELEALWAGLPDDSEITVVIEPTRNAWVPLASWFRRKGATVVMVPSEQSADLRDYYSKHTKSDRLDSKLLPRSHCCTPRASTHSSTSARPSRSVGRRGCARAS